MSSPSTSIIACIHAGCHVLRATHNFYSGLCGCGCISYSSVIQLSPVHCLRIHGLCAVTFIYSKPTLQCAAGGMLSSGNSPLSYPLQGWQPQRPTHMRYCSALSHARPSHWLIRQGRAHARWCVFMCDRLQRVGGGLYRKQYRLYCTVL